MRTKNILVIIFFLLILSQLSSTDVLIITDPAQKEKDNRLLEISCRFYGLETMTISSDYSKKKISLNDIISNNNIKAIVLYSNLFNVVNDIIIKGYSNKFPPILFTNISSNSKSSELLAILIKKSPFLNTINNIKTSSKPLLFFQGNKDVIKHLENIKIPIQIKNLTYFNDQDQNHQNIMSIIVKEKNLVLPIFLKTTYNEMDIFLLAENNLFLSSKESDNSDILNLLPYLIFLKYSGKEYCWNSPKKFANLTIDDPWLTEPYGCLNYKDLLIEMEKTNFHTSIAFIAWNYDRNKKELVDLINNNSHRYSICIHGNNHDHKEFNYYKDRPLHLHEENIIQALARMEKLKHTMGITYDRVMVFPHNIAPLQTLGLLKKYNFLGTFNSTNIPLGEQENNDLLFALRPGTLNYSNFPSFKRYYPNRSKYYIAIDLFLGNPILFYDHHSLFCDGINNFNKTASLVNELEPETEWVSLSKIIKYNYLERLLDNNSYEIKAFSSNFIIYNDKKTDMIYHITKQEIHNYDIKELTVGGKKYTYNINGDQIESQILIPQGQTRHFIIEYKNDLDINTVDLSKKGFIVSLLRYFSDFRDIFLSENKITRTIINYYYDIGLYKYGLIGLLLIFICFISFIVFCIILTNKLIKKRRVK